MAWLWCSKLGMGCGSTHACVSSGPGSQLQPHPHPALGFLMHELVCTGGSASVSFSLLAGLLRASLGSLVEISGKALCSWASAGWDVPREPTHPWCR